MKTIFSLIKIAIIFAFIMGAFFLLINKTFIYETYKSDIMEGDGIPIKRFSYLLSEDNDLNVKLISPLSNSVLTEKKEKYLSNLTSCYNKYYYDEEENITITKYEVKSNKYLREINIGYASGNYCSDEYKLSDMWVYEYINISTYTSGDITSKGVTGLIDKIYNSKRVEDPIIKEYESKINLKVNCNTNSKDYNLYFSDFSENELLVKKESYGKIKIAIYEIDDVVNYLNSLERSK